MVDEPVSVFREDASLFSFCFPEVDTEGVWPCVGASVFIGLIIVPSEGEEGDGGHEVDPSWMDVAKIERHIDRQSRPVVHILLSIER